MIKRFKCTLELVTPVIVNSGEYYDVLEYIPVEGKTELKNGYVAYKYKQADLSSISNIQNFSDFGSFINGLSDASLQRDNQRLKDYREKIKSCKEICFGNVLDNASKDLRNRPCQQISKIVTDKYSNRPYIPGSSIKGALRTAIIEAARKTNNIEPYDRMKGRDFEAMVMNNNPKLSIDKDPFKYLKISDFMLKKSGSTKYIGKVLDKMPIYTEMTDASIFHDKGVVADGIISVDSRFYDRWLDINDLGDLLSEIGDFYVDNLNKALRKAGVGPKYIVNTLENAWKDHCYIIRLGHYCGISNITLNVKNPKPPQNASEEININGGKTKYIEKDIIPGICVLKLVKELK